jgi:hypothetical protein
MTDHSDDTQPRAPQSNPVIARLEALVGEWRWEVETRLRLDVYEDWLDGWSRAKYET